jgi:hypothetical protein
MVKMPRADSLSSVLQLSDGARQVMRKPISERRIAQIDEDIAEEGGGV